MVSQIIIVLWLTITVGAITDLPSTFFNITDVPIRNTSCSAAVTFTLTSNLTFPFIGTIQYIEYVSNYIIIINTCINILNAEMLFC